MRSILVYADRSDEMTARLETALSLARTTKGHITVLIDTPVARFMAMDALGGGYLAADAVRDAVERDDAYAKELAAHLTREDVPFTILRGEEEPVEALAEAALLADIVVLSRDCDFAGQLAVTGRVPVLLVSADEILTTPVESVAIGWDGTQEAAAAIRSALPLLRLANKVTLLTIGDKPDVFPATDAAEYLSRHGISADILTVERVGSIEQTIAAAVARVDAGLLVMGAFGHSRLREFLIGGVTRYFLDLKDGPALLLAH